MKIFLNKKDLIKTIDNKNSLGFVPTMGAIHMGHLSLIKRSIAENNKTIVSIFINKPQFNENADFKKYPRILNKDISILKRTKIDYLYIPASKQIYPYGYKRKIKINSFAKKLCGKYRPGHFEAVVDVIERFIKIIKPRKIYLGEKDMQQLKIIENYINKKKIGTIVVGCRTIREKNGIALSSRNQLLTTKERKIASNIYKYLLNKKKELINKKKSILDIKKTITKFGVAKIDYIKILDVNRIIKPNKKKRRFKIFIAYFLGAVRLIDNI